MHPDPQLVEMFRAVRSDARSDPEPPEIPRLFTIDIGFDGGGSIPTVGSAKVLPLGLIKGRIVGAVIAANAVGSATIELRHGTLTDLPTLAQMYGPTGTIPKLTNAVQIPLNISTWTINLQPNDVLTGKLVAVSGSLTSVTLSLYCRHVKWPAGGTTLTDTGGDTLLTTGGATVTLRS